MSDNRSYWFSFYNKILVVYKFTSIVENFSKCYFAVMFTVIFCFRFLQSKSGIYCGPLKMLAVEIFQKCNDASLNCDLVTGEERKLADVEGEVA